MRRWWSQLRALFHRRRVDEDLRAEIDAHFQMEVDANRERGMSAEDAATRARRDFGSLAHVHESARDTWTLPLLESVLQDIRFGLRMMRKTPGFTAVAMVTLAVGVGANTAIFSLIKAILLEPLPYAQADRLVQLESIWDDSRAHPPLSIAKFVTFQQQRELFEDATLYWTYGGRVNLTGGDRPEQLGAAHVSANYFRLFGADTALGRAFSADEDRPGGPHVVVISSGLWHRRFGADSTLIGKAIGIGGVPYEVIGVLAENFRWNPPVDVWLPLQVDLNSIGPSHEYYAAARLRPGVTLEQANAAMKGAFEGFRRKFPGPLAFPGNGLAVERLHDVVVRDVRSSLPLLFGTAVFVLLIACTNIANLLLVRASVRSREIAIRAALSASRGRIIRQLLTESALLSSGGALLGLVLGSVGLHVLLAMSPGNLPRIRDGASVAIDTPVLLFALVVALLTTFICGLMPAFHAARADLNARLKTGGPRSGIGIRRMRVRSLLAVAQIALAMVLLVGAALLIRTTVALRAVNPGFDGHNVLAMDMVLDGPRFKKAAEVARLTQHGTHDLETLAGVDAAATSWSLPLEPPTDPQFFTIEGRPVGDKPYHGVGDWRLITPHYFDVFRIPVVRGRSFSEHDEVSGVPVVIINRAMATAFWQGGDPVGSQIWLNKGLGEGFEEFRPREVVGVAADVQDGGLSAQTGPIMYVPVAQVGDNVLPFYSQAFHLMWIVRTKIAPLSFSDEIQRRLRQVSGGLPVGHVRSMDQVRLESTARNDFTASLLSVFAGLALLIAALGIYGVLAHGVAQRRQEIGIRMALGATPQIVRQMILQDGARLAIIGTVIGVPSALALTRLLAGFLFGVQPRDPAAFVAVIVLLNVVALFACGVPAQRAARVEPSVVLRNE